MRAVADVGQNLGCEHELRLRAITALRDLYLRKSDFAAAARFQRDLLDCRLRRLGAEHPETLLAQTDLASIQFASVDNAANQQL